MVMIYSTQETYDMLQDILKNESSLNTWESAFINDIVLIVDSREDVAFLTPKERAKIGEIYDTRIR